MSEENYFKIRVATVLPDRPVPVDLYLHINGKLIHYLRIGDAMSYDKIEHLTKADVFFVPNAQRAQYKNYVYAGLNGDKLPLEEKARLLRESSMTLAEEIFEQEDVKTALEESKEMINTFINFMDQEPLAISHLVGLSAHDFYTYNHSLDVGIYSLGLGRVAGYTGADLEELGRGALFHDIGKRMVDVNIITKNGSLNDAEWAQMQKHPQFGLEILMDYSVSDAIKACCFEHHENFLGNGYPQQLSGPEIHPMARIVAITDTYDALTTKRSYNQPMPPQQALEFMTTKLLERYDQDLLKAMHSVLFKMKKAS